MNKIKFEKLTDDAIIPVKITDGAIAFDIAIPRDYKVKPYSENFGRQKIDLEFAIQLPKGCEAKIEARSGFSLKGMEGYGIIKKPPYTSFIAPDFSRNVVQEQDDADYISESATRFDCDVISGKVDSDYTGEVGVILQNRGGVFLLKKGTRVAQMTIYHSDPDWEFVEVDSLNETERGDGGFGHSGSKSVYGTTRHRKMAQVRK